MQINFSTPENPDVGKFSFELHGLPKTDQERELLLAAVELLLQFCACATQAYKLSPAKPTVPCLGVRLLDAGTTKIDVIRTIRTHTGFGMADSKTIVDRLPTLPHTFRCADAFVADKFWQALIVAGATAELVP